MDVFFIDVNDTGRNVIHGFGCPMSKPSDREFLGLYNNLNTAIKGALVKFSKVTPCNNCCCEDSEPARQESDSFPSFSY
jgi:hypothetical protein